MKKRVDLPIKQLQTKTVLPLTTGSVAAAAAKAAALLWLTKKKVAMVKISGPQNNWQELLSVYRQFLTKKAALCWLKKPANQDYDITQKLIIGAKVEPRLDKQIVLKRGFGVGIVTKPGLLVAVGQPAINPVTQSQIKANLKELKAEHGFTVTFYIPQGAEVAKKSFNPQLGIVKGLSLIGTTGLVKPMSRPAYKKALALKLTQAAALGYKEVVLVPGEVGAQAAAKLLKASPEQTVMVSNFVGYMFKQAARLGLRAVFLGHIGKVIKVAAGYHYTHSQATPDRCLLIVKTVAKWDAKLANELKEAVTAEQAAQVLKEKKRLILKRIAALATANLKKWLASAKLEKEVVCQTVIIDWQGNFLASDKPLPSFKGEVC